MVTAAQELMRHIFSVLETPDEHVVSVEFTFSDFFDAGVLGRAGPREWDGNGNIIKMLVAVNRQVSLNTAIHKMLHGLGIMGLKNSPYYERGNRFCGAAVRAEFIVCAFYAGGHLSYFVDSRGQEVNIHPMGPFEAGHAPISLAVLAVLDDYGYIIRRNPLPPVEFPALLNPSENIGQPIDGNGTFYASLQQNVRGLCKNPIG